MSDMPLDEALAKADENGEGAGKGIPSVSRTLAAEVRRLQADLAAALKDADEFRLAMNMAMQHMDTAINEAIARYNDSLDAEQEKTKKEPAP